MLIAQKANRNLSCIKRIVASRDREMILSLCSDLIRPHLENCIQLWRPSAQERHGPVGAGLEEGHKNFQRAGTPLLREKDETDGVVHPGEEKAPGRPYSGFSIYKEAYKTDGEKLFIKACSDRTRDNSFKLKEGRFGLDIRKKLFYDEDGEALEQIAERNCGCPLPWMSG